MGLPLSPLTQSTMRILPTLSRCCSSLAEMATELKKQKPLGTRDMGHRWRGWPWVGVPALSLYSHGRGLLGVVAWGADDGEAILGDREGHRGTWVALGHNRDGGHAWDREGHGQGGRVSDTRSP